MMQGIYIPFPGKSPSARGKCHQKGKVFLLLEEGLPVHVCPDTQREWWVWPSCIRRLGSGSQGRLLLLSDLLLPDLQWGNSAQPSLVTQGGLSWIGSSWPGLALCVRMEQAWTVFSAGHSERLSGPWPPSSRSALSRRTFVYLSIGLRVK